MADLRASITVWSGDSLTIAGEDSPDILAQGTLSEYQFKKALRMFVVHGAKRRSRILHPHRQQGYVPPFRCFVSVEWVLPHVWLQYYLHDYPCEEVE